MRLNYYDFVKIIVRESEIQMQWVSDNWLLVVLPGWLLVYLMMRRHGRGYEPHHNHNHDDKQGKAQPMVNNEIDPSAQCLKPPVKSAIDVTDD